MTAAKFVTRHHAIAAGHLAPYDVEFEFVPLSEVADTVYRRQRSTHGSHPAWTGGDCPRCAWATKLMTALEAVAVEVFS
jgi:hypothetical protein